MEAVATTAVSATTTTRFHPQGRRSFYAVGRAGNYGIGLTEEQYAKGANQETLVILQVEEQEGVRNLDEILSVPDVDAIQVGPKDLWQSLGMPDRSVVSSVVERVLGQISKAGHWGSMVVRLDGDAKEQIRRGMGLGVRMVTVSPRDLLMNGGQHFLEEAAEAFDA